MGRLLEVRKAKISNLLHGIEYKVWPAAPRRVKRTDGSFLIFYVAIAFFSLVSLRMTSEALHFGLNQAFGSTVSGRIITYDVSRSSKGGTSYYVEYSYIVEGKQYEANTRISGKDYGVVPLYAAIKVRVLKPTPQLWPFPILTAQSATRHTMSLWFWSAISTIMPGIAVIFMYSALRSRHLVQNGIPSSGIILEMEKLKDLNRRNPDWRVFYEFRAEDGTTHRNSMRVEQAQINGINEGDDVTVFYDPFNPRRSVIYVLSCWKVLN